MVNERNSTTLLTSRPGFQIAVTASSFTIRLLSHCNKPVRVSPVLIRTKQTTYLKPLYLTPATMLLPTKDNHEQQQQQQQQKQEHPSRSILMVERPANEIDMNVVVAHNQRNDTAERFNKRSATIAIAISIITSLSMCCALGSTMTLFTSSKTRSAVVRALKTAFEQRRKLFVHVASGLQQLLLAATLFISATVISIKLCRGGRSNPDFSYIEANPSTF